MQYLYLYLYLYLKVKEGCNYYIIIEGGADGGGLEKSLANYIIDEWKNGIKSIMLRNDSWQ